MNLLLIQKPGIRLFKELRLSETAWHAIKFYEPVELQIGCYIRISTIANALSLISDLKYFIRRYTADHLLELRAGLFCTAALGRQVYLDRDQDFSDEWQYRFMYRVSEKNGITRKRMNNPFSEEEYLNGIYFFEVWSTGIEYDAMTEKKVLCEHNAGAPQS